MEISDSEGSHCDKGVILKLTFGEKWRNKVVMCTDLHNLRPFNFVEKDLGIFSGRRVFWGNFQAPHKQSL